MEYKRTPLQALMQLAAAESYSLRSDSIEVEHVLLAMMKTAGPETEALTRAGANYNTLRKVILSNSEPGTATQPPTQASSGLRRLLDQARQIAAQNGEKEVWAEYVLLGMLNDRSSMVSVMLTVADIDKQQIYQTLISRIQEGRKAEDESNLAKYGKDLNEQARQGKIDPVIGRQEEINRVIQILSRRTKNNPVLIGEPGVGKTAIAEGLAQRIVSGDIPDIMKKKTVFSIDMSSMVAGTKYRGDFEQRLNDTIAELMKREDMIVFIDELHTIIGAGSAEGTLDASNILKPALAKGALQVIGATTVEEYRQKIEKDAALERRFQPVMVEEPSRSEAIDIIRGLKSRYEQFHQVRMSDDAIQAAVELTDRYLTDRFLPDKAIDVLDEAQARVRVNSFHIAPELLAMEEHRKQLEEEKTKAALTQDFERAAALRDELQTLEKSYQEHVQLLKQEPGHWPMIGYDDVAHVVSQWAKVPVTRLTEKESDRYLHLAEELKKRVIGQDYAVDTVASAIKRARVGLKAPNRPIGTFIFVGPTGVGKTYLAKAIAQSLFGDENSLIRIDMSEYMEKYSVSRLVGAAPGYVGYEEGGQLTEAVRSKPYSVVLFDEIEKAHPDVFNLLLQLLDDGRLTDSKGRTVDFRNTVVILTSNVGATRLEKSNRLGFGSSEHIEQDEYERMTEIVHESLKQTFRPEFLNRLDDTVLFHRLSEESTLQIAKLLLDELLERMQAQGYDLRYTPTVAQHLAKEGYSADFGARPLEREIRSRVENLLAEKILSGEMKQGVSYELRLHRQEIVIEENRRGRRKTQSARGETSGEAALVGAQEAEREQLSVSVEK
ncbi:MAG: ATP-dependent Clp protease ATP-binding subunit [Ndongobacter sp.]|nr:ATP-dependent Clp protease ATP-binding subunit [Ndongobacter sp.]